MNMFIYPHYELWVQNNNMIMHLQSAVLQEDHFEVSELKISILSRPLTSLSAQTTQYAHCFPQHKTQTTIQKLKCEIPS